MQKERYVDYARAIFREMNKSAVNNNDGYQFLSSFLTSEQTKNEINPGIRYKAIDLFTKESSTAFDVILNDLTISDDDRLRFLERAIQKSETSHRAYPYGIPQLLMFIIDKSSENNPGRPFMPKADKQTLDERVGQIANLCVDYVSLRNMDPNGNGLAVYDTVPNLQAVPARLRHAFGEHGIFKLNRDNLIEAIRQIRNSNSSDTKLTPGNPELTLDYLRQLSNIPGYEGNVSDVDKTLYGSILVRLDEYLDILNADEVAITDTADEDTIAKIFRDIAIFDPETELAEDDVNDFERHINDIFKKMKKHTYVLSSFIPQFTKGFQIYQHSINLKAPESTYTYVLMSSLAEQSLFSLNLANISFYLDHTKIDFIPETTAPPSAHKERYIVDSSLATMLQKACPRPFIGFPSYSSADSLQKQQLRNIRDAIVSGTIAGCFTSLKDSDSVSSTKQAVEQSLDIPVALIKQLGTPPVTNVTPLIPSFETQPDYDESDSYHWPDPDPISGYTGMILQRFKKEGIILAIPENYQESDE